MAELPAVDLPKTVGHDIRPYPETPEAVALGCKCSVARHRDGSPSLNADGGPLYAMTKGCPVPTHN
jgi:hypothetical protein